jgi:hypothetical protein
MITKLSDADAEMAELFRQEWVVKAGYKCEWPNHKESEHEAGDTWARWHLDYLSGNQLSMGGGGRRKFNKYGMIYIDIYTPLGTGLATARNASQIAIFAYEGKRTPSDVWFRNVRIESEGHGHGTGRNKSWWTTLVVAEFTYDYLR